MTGDELRKFRDRRGLTQKELADLINAALPGRKTDAETVARWERGGRGIGKPVSAFLDELALSGGIAGDLPDVAQVAASREPDEPGSILDGDPYAGDTAPGPGPAAPAPQPMLTGSTLHARACEELWEMIAAGVGMVGAATGNLALMQDGAIIAADKEALGAAWGKLAETNDTFRRMLVGMTEGGAWLAVAMVTGTTVSKCWQSHVAIAESQLDFPHAHADVDQTADAAPAAA